MKKMLFFLVVLASLNASATIKDKIHTRFLTLLDNVDSWKFIRYDNNEATSIIYYPDSYTQAGIKTLVARVGNNESLEVVYNWAERETGEMSIYLGIIDSEYLIRITYSIKKPNVIKVKVFDR